MLRRVRAMAATILRRKTLDRAIDDEFALHIDLLADDLVRRGTPRDDAVRQARLAFGNTTIAKESARAATGITWLDTLSQDLRFAVRTLRKNVGLAAVAVLSLGFGIGAVTTVFSVIDKLDFRPLPYADADRLVWLAEVAPPDDRMCAGCAWSTAPATARDWVSQVHSYDALVVTTKEGFTWEHDDVEESPGAGLATPGLLHLFGLRPVVGRDLASADTMPGANPVILLTYEFWQTRFGRDPNIVGMQLRARVGGLTTPVQTLTVIGVAPKDFHVMPAIKLWGAMPLGRGTSRTSRFTTVIGRLKLGASIPSATAELQGLSARLARAYPMEYRGWSVRVEPLRERLGWGAGGGRGVFFAITMAVLLIAVLNVAGLLSARAVARQPEFAMRAALGAGRVRLFRQLLVEGTCIGIFGGLVGAAIAFGGVHVAARWFAFPTTGLDLDVDPRMLSFAALVSLIVGVAAAVAPAARAARMDASRTLRPRVTAVPRVSRASNVLITLQIALAFMLLSAAGLLSREFLELRYLDLGYNPRGLFETSISAPREQWSNPGPWKPVVTETRARIAAIHGIQSASVEYENAMHPSIVHPDTAAGSSVQRVPRVKAVAADFFKTLNNPVLVGRQFLDSDRAGAPLVAIVSRACATEFWPGRNPLGRRVFLGDSGSIGEWLTVVGVTEDVENGDFADRHSPVVYRPFTQATLYHAAVGLAVRIAGDRSDALSSAQSIIRQVTGRRSGPFESAESALETRFLTPRFNAIALDVFAGFGLLLAAMGIYGSIAFAVTQRTREIGIRVALGAARASVLGMVARRGIVIALAGACIGAAGSLALARVFNSFIAATSVTNPGVIAGSVVAVLGVALIATFLPARRATAVNPVIALRAE